MFGYGFYRPGYIGIGWGFGGYGGLGYGGFGGWGYGSFGGWGYGYGRFGGFGGWGGYYNPWFGRRRRYYW